MGRRVIDIDNWNMVGDLVANPLTNAWFVCQFHAIPLRHLGMYFRNLSDYGTIIEEGPQKLVIRIMQERPGEMMLVIRNAWTTRYQEMGALCRMYWFGPLDPYQPVELTIERFGAGAGDILREQPQERRGEPAREHTGTDASPMTLSSIPEEVETPSLLTSQQEIGHPHSHHGYFGEINVQFSLHRAQFPEAYQQPNGIFFGGGVSNQDHQTRRGRRARMIYEGPRERYETAQNPYVRPRRGRQQDQSKVRGDVGGGTDTHPSPSNTGPGSGGSQGVKRPAQEALPGRRSNHRGGKKRRKSKHKRQSTTEAADQGNGNTEKKGEETS